MKRRNEAARALRDPRFKPKVKPPKKGMRAYRRKGRDNRKVPGPYDSGVPVFDVWSPIVCRLPPGDRVAS